MITEIALLGAAAFSGIWFAVHVFVGEGEVARPLRQGTDLTATARDTAFLCWHLDSITLALMAVFFLMGAFVSKHYAWAALLLSAGFAAVGLILPRLISAPYARLPQGWLFVPVVLLGLFGVVA